MVIFMNCVTFLGFSRLTLWKIGVRIRQVCAWLIIVLGLSGMIFAELNSDVEVKMGYNDNINLRNDKNKEGGRVAESYLNLESRAGASSLRYNFGWMQNPPLSILDTGYSLPEGKSTRNHRLTARHNNNIFSVLSFEIKGQGEYNDADLKELTFQKYSVSGHMEHNFSDRNNAGVEVKYTRRFYNKSSPTRTDISKTISTNTSYIFLLRITGYLEYQYTTNDSDMDNYTFRGYGPTGMVSVPITAYTDLRVIMAQETRNYDMGFTDKSVIIAPSFINKRLKYIRIFLEYSYQKNDSGLADRRFIQNRYSGGLNISF